MNPEDLSSSDMPPAMAPTQQRRPRRAVLRTAAAAIAYALIIGVCFAPALPTFSTRMIGDGGDNLQFAWNAWWTANAVTHGRNPYFCHLQFAPYGVPLVLHTLAPIPSLVIGLLTHGVGLIAAYNTVVLALFVLAGVGAFALARGLTHDSLGAFVGGAAFMLCPYMASKSLGHLNLLCAGLLPIYTFCLLRAIHDDARRWRWAILAVFVVMLFSNIHTTLFAANVTAWYFVYRGVRTRAWRDEFRRFRRALRPVAGVCAAWGAVIVYYAIRYGVAPDRFGNVAWCPEPRSFVLPLHRNSVWHDHVAPAGGLGWDLGSVELAVYVGWFVLPMAIAGLWMHRRDARVRLMAWLFVGALLLAPGQKLQWDRQIVHVAGATVYLPMGLYRYVPILGAVGQSGRYMVIAYMAMSVGVAAMLARIREPRSRPAFAAAAGLALALIATDYAFRPIATAPPACPIPPGAGRVLDPRIGNARSLYWQTIHRRPLVGGYVARVPDRIRDDYRAMPGLGWFFQKPERRGTPPAPDDVLAALRRLDVRYVTVDADGPEQALIRRCGLRMIDHTDHDATFVADAD